MRRQRYHWPQLVRKTTFFLWHRHFYFSHRPSPLLRSTPPPNTLQEVDFESVFGRFSVIFSPKRPKVDLKLTRPSISTRCLPPRQERVCGWKKVSTLADITVFKCADPMSLKTRSYKRNIRNFQISLQNHLRSFSARNSGAGNGCTNLWAPGVLFFLLENPMTIQFLLIRRGLGFLGKGGWKCRFYFFMGVGIFLKNSATNTNQKFIGGTCS